MNDIKFKKSELLTVLKKNRASHSRIAAEAQAGFRAKVIKQLERNLAKAKSGGKVELYVNLPNPEDNTEVYDRIIQMLSMATEPEVSLTEEEFSNYVMDKWVWKGKFMASNALYSKAAR